MKEYVKEHLKNFEEYFNESSEKESKAFINALIVSPKTDPSFINIINLFEKYKEFKNLENKKKKLIISDFIIDFPKTFFLTAGIITYIFILALSVILFWKTNIIIGALAIILIVLILISIYRKNKLREEQYSYYYYYLRKLLKEDFFDE